MLSQQLNNIETVGQNPISWIVGRDAHLHRVVKCTSKGWSRREQAYKVPTMSTTTTTTIGMKQI